jgi:starch-binding outer membrane protein, SusD/RagB family
MNRSRVIVIVISLLFSSCKKFIQVDPPINPIPSEVVFSNDSSAISSLSGIYNEMMLSLNGITQFSASGITIYTGLYSDELRYSTAQPGEEFQRSFLTQTSHETLTRFLWDRAYRYIYTANLCIEELNKSAKLTSWVKTKLLGEAKFVRAFSYFHLVNIFGGVPLPLGSDYRDNIKLIRATEEEVYQQIIKDLREAQALLPATYDSPDRVRPIKWAATALLARVLLYRGKWVDAETEATAVIDAGPYYLVSNLALVFKKESEESIWQLQSANVNVNTWEGSLFIPTASPTTPPNYLVTDSLLKAFEIGDARRIQWIGAKKVSNYTDSLYYPAKYKIRTSGAISENYIVFRLAEQYLIRAEARAHQNKLDEALEDLNRIRNRADLASLNTMSLQELLTNIEHERRIELFAEWGNRWYDLRRTGRANEVLGAMKPATWKPTAMLWPIPISQIRANPGLVQNPGY